MGNHLSSSGAYKTREDKDHLNRSVDSLLCVPEDRRSFVTDVGENYGTISCGNKFNNTFVNCQNVKVFLQPVEAELEPSPRKSRAQSHADDLADLTESLKILYSSENSWLVPFQWLDSKKFEPKDYFIQTDIEELDRGGMKVIRRAVPVESILDTANFANVVAPKRILLQAEAGFGKTAICTRIVYDWATKQNTNFHKFDLIIFVRLQSVLGELDTFISKFAAKACTNNISHDRVAYLLSTLRGRLLLLLDGLDECSPDILKSVSHVLGFDHSSPNQSYLRLATIMMTTRPTLASKMTVYSDRHIRIRSMSKEERKRFVEGYFESQENSNSAKSVQSLFSREFNWDVSPLILFLICVLGERGQLFPTHGESGVFNQILKLLGKRFLASKDPQCNDQTIELHLSQLGELCFNLLKRKTMIFRNEEIPDLCICPEEFVTGCGIFKKELAYKHNLVDTYEPVHKRFVEHLAALYLQRQCNQRSDPSEKLAFVKSVIQRPSRTFRRVVVYEVEKDKKICFQSCICEGSLDVFIEASYAQGKSCKSLTVEVLLYSESVARLQTWRGITSPVYFQSVMALKIQPEDQSQKLKCIPERFREEVSIFFDGFGCVLCELMIHRECACATDTKIFRNDATDVIEKLASFNYREKRVKCRACTFYKKQGLVDMILTGEKYAASFDFRSSPANINDTQILLSKLCSRYSSAQSNTTTNICFSGDSQGLATMLTIVLKVAGMSSSSFKSLKFESIGKLLIRVLRMFGLSEEDTENFLPVRGKQQCLRILYGGFTHSFTKDVDGNKAYKSSNDRDQKPLTFAIIKKLLNYWNNEKSDYANSTYRLELLSESRKLNCDLTVTAKHCVEGCDGCDYVSWFNWKL